MGLSQEKRQRNQESLGSRLKARREALGFTQKALARELGLEYYTMVSQMELGYISIPASLWAPIADALQMDKSQWVLYCLDEIAPDIYSALFGNVSLSEAAEFLTKLRKGDLEVNGGNP